MSNPLFDYPRNWIYLESRINQKLNTVAFCINSQYLKRIQLKDKISHYWITHQCTALFKLRWNLIAKQSKNKRISIRVFHVKISVRTAVFTKTSLDLFRWNEEYFASHSSLLNFKLLTSNKLIKTPPVHFRQIDSGTHKTSIAIYFQNWVYFINP